MTLFIFVINYLVVLPQTYFDMSMIDKSLNSQNTGCNCINYFKQLLGLVQMQSARSTTTVSIQTDGMNVFASFPGQDPIAVIMVRFN